MFTASVEALSHILSLHLPIQIANHRYTAGVSSLLVCALVASMCMVGFGILSEQEARDAVNWEVFVTIAAAFGIGTALVNSGVAGGVADFLVTVGTSVGEGCKFFFPNRNLSFSKRLSFLLCVYLMWLIFLQLRVCLPLSILPHS